MCVWLIFWTTTSTRPSGGNGAASTVGSTTSRLLLRSRACLAYPGTQRASLHIHDVWRPPPPSMPVRSVPGYVGQTASVIEMVSCPSTRAAPATGPTRMYTMIVITYGFYIIISYRKKTLCAQRRACAGVVQDHQHSACAGACAGEPALGLCRGVVQAYYYYSY
jgi:hypothetical protein